ncbi:uncharacterized protein A1O5_12409 [Cladophialophora psammophila CBS 110553]|uniref:Xylanolytic transcriptional activator regulatory domain-containing protein n=1 Tax=Cladophialophora psammophila CBS 110553 TaxID=1182543 RepID=W9W041_9EURO|nr:uncharacterized protein A1O5_12409 [Cladophialophora psammophila CBS 110553]EXJ57851.1 hypothetical protein A1O5_12409 [Cladophialophora psammophila CBS 110553]
MPPNFPAAAAADMRVLAKNAGGAKSDVIENSHAVIVLSLKRHASTGTSLCNPQHPSQHPMLRLSLSTLSNARGAASIEEEQQSSVDHSTISSFQKEAEINELKRRIASLEDLLGRGAHSAEEANPMYRPAPSDTCDPLDLAHLPENKCLVLNKSRFQRIAVVLSGETEEPLVDELTKHTLSETRSLLRTCKLLASSRKAVQIEKCFDQKPPCIPIGRVVATKLTQLYVSHFESTFRILHVPTFWKEFERFWASSAEISRAIFLQIQLVPAIGSSIFLESSQDDPIPTRSLVYQWVQSAYNWLSGPTEKGRLSIDGLQVQCLLVLARQVLAIGADLLYITMGHVIRMAIQMGLHRDPRHFHKMTPLQVQPAPDPYLLSMSFC